jgi:hypothetical protein
MSDSLLAFATKVTSTTTFVDLPKDTQERIRLYQAETTTRADGGNCCALGRRLLGRSGAVSRVDHSRVRHAAQVLDLRGEHLAPDVHLETVVEPEPVQQI